MPTEPEIADAVAALTGERPARVTRLRGGANNVVARVDLGDRPLVAKLYFTHPGDRRDRVGTEFATLSFLWERGLRCIPEPIAVDGGRHAALYEFVDGAPVEPDDVGPDEVEQLVSLLGSMSRLRRDPAAAAFPPASEAYFSIEAYVRAMAARLARLEATLADANEARRFVATTLRPAAGSAFNAVVAGTAELGVDPAAELPVERRTLSPADFGFHNALRRADGSLVFIDFEYAGWDDPAVVLSQAAVAPAVPVPPALRGRLLRRLLEELDGGDWLAARLRLMLPLVALKWSMVVLNEFVPVSQERRAFAGAPPLERRARQLEKSRRLVATVDEALAGSLFAELD